MLIIPGIINYGEKKRKTIYIYISFLYQLQTKLITAMARNVSMDDVYLQVGNVFVTQDTESTTEIVVNSLAMLL